MNNQINDPEYTSILDKTDWKRTIQRALEKAVFSKGKYEIYWYNVERAIQSISAEYPGWDAGQECRLMVRRIKKKYRDLIIDYFSRNPYNWAIPWVKYPKIDEFKDKMYDEILQKLLDIAGFHRMLLWGVSDSKGVGYDQLSNKGNP